MTRFTRTIVCVIAVSILVVNVYTGKADDWRSWNLAYSDSVTLSLTGENPVKISLIDGTDFDYQVLLATENQEIKAYVTGEDFDLSQVVKVNESKLSAELTGVSILQSLFSSDEKEIEFSATGEGFVSFKWDLGDLPHDSKQVKALIKARGSGGLLQTNISSPEIGRPSDEEVVSRTLKISINQARKFLEEKGNRLLNALEQLKNTGNRNGYSVLRGDIPAGAGGAIIEGEGGAINVNTMDPSSVFQVFLDSPKYKGNLQDSQLRVKLIHETTNTPLRGVGGTITVAGPVDGANPNTIVLLDAITYDQDQECYFYQFDPEDWLIDYERLQPGGYNLHIDFGTLQRATLGVTVTKDKKLFYGRY